MQTEKSKYVVLRDDIGNEVVTVAVSGSTYGLGVGVFDASGNRMPTGDAVGRAIYNRITDGVTVAGVTLDGKLKVDASVTSTPAYAQGNDVLNALNDFMTINTLGYSTLYLHVVGAFSGTISIYGTINGTQLFAIPAVQRATNTVLTQITTTGAYVINCSSLSAVQLLMSPYVSGSATIYWITSMGTSPVESFGLGSTTGNSVIIRDPTVPTRQALVDSQGRLHITMAPSISRTIELWYYNASIANYVANMWRSMLKYTVPNGYTCEITVFTAMSGNIASSSRAVLLRSMGTFVVNTNVFTDGDAYTFPGFASIVEAEVTTVFGGANTLTVTYVNQDGVGGRTGTIAVTNGAAVRHRFVMTLQAGDIGVQDITNVTRSANVEGAVILYGVRQCFYERTRVADQSYQQIASRQSVIVEPGQQISLEITATNTTASIRLVRLLGLLIPE